MKSNKETWPPTVYESLFSQRIVIQLKIKQLEKILPFKGHSIISTHRIIKHVVQVNKDPSVLKRGQLSATMYSPSITADFNSLSSEYISTIFTYWLFQLCLAFLVACIQSFNFVASIKRTLSLVSPQFSRKQAITSSVAVVLGTPERKNHRQNFYCACPGHILGL